jgi:hypothetical protein
VYGKLAAADAVIISQVDGMACPASKLLYLRQQDRAGAQTYGAASGVSSGVGGRNAISELRA